MRKVLTLLLALFLLAAGLRGIRKWVAYHDA